MVWLIVAVLVVGIAGLVILRRRQTRSVEDGGVTEDNGGFVETVAAVAEHDQGVTSHAMPTPRGSREGTGEDPVGTDEADPDPRVPGHDFKGASPALTALKVREPERARRPTKDRGGQPRRPDDAQPKHPEPPEASPCPRLYTALRCLWIDGEWHVGLTVDGDGQEVTQNSEPEVTQDGEPLDRNPHHNAWILRSLKPVHLILPEGDERTVDVRSSGKPVVIFRLAQSGKEGRVVRAPGVGLFGFMVPGDWRLDSDQATPLEPQSAAYGGYVVHFIEVEEGRDARVVFRTQDGRYKVFPRRQSTWELQGRIVPDASRRMGPLYIGDVPRLRRTEPSSPVVSAVIGQEGPASDVGPRWRAVIDVRDPTDAVARALEEAPRAVGEAGWFYLRLYDHHDQLVERGYSLHSSTYYR